MKNNKHFKKMEQMIGNQDINYTNAGFNNGAIKAFLSWRESVSYKEQIPALTLDILETDIPDFLDTLKTAGFTEFVLATRNSGIIDDIHILLSEGGSFQGPVTIQRFSRYHNEMFTIHGLVFSLN